MPPDPEGSRADDDVRQQLDEECGDRVVRAGGLRVGTTLDATLQRADAVAIREALPSPRDPQPRPS